MVEDLVEDLVEGEDGDLGSEGGLRLGPMLA